MKQDQERDKRKTENGVKGRDGEGTCTPRSQGINAPADMHKKLVGF